MNIFKIHFAELYERHLCRHSQFGINVVHLAMVFGIYFALAGILSWIVGSDWLLLCLIVPHLILVAFNVPLRVFVGCVLLMAFFFASFVFIPKAPLWIDILAIPVLYKIQSWSHIIYNASCDMTEFNMKYRKGYVLFVLLSLYEIPLLLNYLLFDRNTYSSRLRPPSVKTSLSSDTAVSVLQCANADSPVLSSQP
jgi:hypothetical protein